MAAEVEKIWILYDVDKNGNLDYDELIQYFNDVAVPCLSLNQSQMYELFSELDQDEDQSISRNEMVLFLAKIITHGDRYNIDLKTVSSTIRAKTGEIEIAKLDEGSPTEK